MIVLLLCAGAGAVGGLASLDECCWNQGRAYTLSRFANSFEHGSNASYCELTSWVINKVKYCFCSRSTYGAHTGFSKMLEINSLLGVLKELGGRTDSLRGYL